MPAVCCFLKSWLDASVEKSTSSKKIDGNVSGSEQWQLSESCMVEQQNTPYKRGNIMMRSQPLLR